MRRIYQQSELEDELLSQFYFFHFNYKIFSFSRIKHETNLLLFSSFQTAAKRCLISSFNTYLTVAIWSRGSNPDDPTVKLKNKYASWLPLQFLLCPSLIVCSSSSNPSAPVNTFPWKFTDLGFQIADLTPLGAVACDASLRLGGGVPTHLRWRHRGRRARWRGHPRPPPPARHLEGRVRCLFHCSRAELRPPRATLRDTFVWLRSGSSREHSAICIRREEVIRDCWCASWEAPASSQGCETFFAYSCPVPFICIGSLSTPNISTSLFLTIYLFFMFSDCKGRRDWKDIIRSRWTQQVQTAFAGIAGTERCRGQREKHHTSELFRQDCKSICSIVLFF